MNAIAIGLTLLMILVAIGAVIFAGARNIQNGKSEPKKLGILSIPFVIFLLSWVITGDSQQAGVVTMIVMMVLMIVTISYTGLKGTFNL